MYKDYNVHLRKCRERYLKNMRNTIYKKKYRARKRLCYRSRRENNIEKFREYARQYAKSRRKIYRSSKHQKVRQITAMAIKCGFLVRPKACIKCFTTKEKIQAHHPDYRKPLTVKWLCSICHGKEHRI